MTDKLLQTSLYSLVALVILLGFLGFLLKSWYLIGTIQRKQLPYLSSNFLFHFAKYLEYLLVL